MARVAMTAKDKFAISGLLREHTVRIDDDHVQYEPGWSDQRIADTVGGIVKWSHVARFRQDAVGDLPHVSGPAKNTKEALAKLEKTTELVISRFNLLAVSAGYPDLGIAPEDLS